MDIDDGFELMRSDDLSIVWRDKTYPEWFVLCKPFRGEGSKLGLTYVVVCKNNHVSEFEDLKKAFKFIKAACRKAVDD